MADLAHPDYNRHRKALVNLLGAKRKKDYRLPETGKIQKWRSLEHKAFASPTTSLNEILNREKKNSSMQEEGKLSSPDSEEADPQPLICADIWRTGSAQRGAAVLPGKGPDCMSQVGHLRGCSPCPLLQASSWGQVGGFWGLWSGSEGSMNWVYSRLPIL